MSDNWYQRTGKLCKWSTEDELLFIQGLGKWAPEAVSIVRSDLRKNYLQALLKRTDWTGLDRNKIISRASIL